MKTYTILSMAITLLLFTACTKDDDPVIDNIVTETLSDSFQNIQDAILAFPTEDLDVGEIEGLIKMREEEKLANDVYVYFYEKYEMKIFRNISESEQTHMFALKVMIDKYNLEDPADNSPAGVFKDSHLQEIYDLLIVKGNRSLTEALIVGTMIQAKKELTGNYKKL